MDWGIEGVARRRNHEGDIGQDWGTKDWDNGKRREEEYWRIGELEKRWVAYESRRDEKI